MPRHPVWFAQGVNGVALHIRNGFAMHFIGGTTVKFHIPRHGDGVISGLGQGLANIGRLDLGQFLNTG